MSLESDRRRFLQQVKKFEETAQELHKLADQVHRKAQEIHLETQAGKKRAGSTRHLAQSKKSNASNPRVTSRRKSR